MSWGTDENWVRVALHFNIEGENPREELVKYLDSHENDRSYGKKLMEDNGIWEMALSLAKSMDLDITPKEKQIYVRLGFSDVVLTKEEAENFNGYADLISEDENSEEPVIAQTRSYHIGYELEDGTECDENGYPLST